MKEPGGINRKHMPVFFVFISRGRPCFTNAFCFFKANLLPGARSVRSENLASFTISKCSWNRGDNLYAFPFSMIENGAGVFFVLLVLNDSFCGELPVEPLRFMMPRLMSERATLSTANCFMGRAVGCVI
jgi:hypothetical protein